MLIIHKGFHFFYKTTMNSLTSLILPSVFGLIAGISHGVISHHAELPLSLSDQLLQTIQVDQSLPN